MSLLRYDVTTGDWIIFAPERGRRPSHGKQAQAPATEPVQCPFCPGQEATGSKEIFTVRIPSGNGWLVRVIANKYPALRIEDHIQRVEDGRLFRHMGGCGAHEVVIESPDHSVYLAHQSPEQIERILGTLHFRCNDLMRDPRFQTIIIFKNHGEGAGTSIRHPHCQIIATPVVPRLLRLKHRVAVDYFDQSGRCLYCDVLSDEMATGERLLVENEHFAAVLPYASYVPYQIRIFPKHRQASFGRADPRTFRALAELLKTVLQKLHFGLHDPDYNLTLNTVPRGDEDEEYFNWHIDILPRLTNPAGFELGSGMAINIVLPEEACQNLRQVQV
ncbi:MAG TPA: galactose-1-phosphate uridylyltransferase [Gemmatales bacterium]|nr:galactose-1-phosphate uridylyltransferase [Gemmatales bacterium]HMP58062.1 galactose-1-phosphate uridylyltransferase [Gemmatales bacterium]